jgi:C4-dicarboxylate-specific signal transduction histidine kinase
MNLQSLSFRFLLAFVAIIIVTTLAAGVPAYISIRAELEKQAWTRVLDSGHVTMALLETEKVRLENLAVLVSKCPTLQDILQQQDVNALNAYLQTMQSTVNLDILVLSEKSGQILANQNRFCTSQSFGSFLVQNRN